MYISIKEIHLDILSIKKYPKREQKTSQKHFYL